MTQPNTNGQTDEEFLKKLQSAASRRRKKLREERIYKSVKGFESHMEVTKEYQKEYMNDFIKVGFSELQGNRPRMEDAVKIIFKFRGNPDEIFIGVFDGHGGCEAAQFVQKHLPVIFEEKITKYYELQEKILKGEKNVDPNSLITRLNTYITEGVKSKEKEAVKKIFKTQAKVEIEYSIEEINILNLHENEAIQVLMRESFFEMHHHLQVEKISQGTTATVVYFRGRNCFIANVGDSRVVLCRDGKDKRLTVDHRPDDDFEKRRILELGGWVTKNKVNGIIGVSRAIGDAYLEPMLTCDPHTKLIQISEKDSFMIVASDGVWDTMSDEEVIKLVQNETDPRISSVNLRDYCYNEMRSMDNISIVIIKFEHQ